jgi:tetratricopeptide (TPR) repeat protein
MKEALKILGVTASIVSSIGSLVTFNDYSRTLFMEKVFGITEKKKLTDFEIEQLKQQAEKAQLETKIAKLEADKLKIQQEKIESELKLKDQIHTENLQSKAEDSSVEINGFKQEKQEVKKNIQVSSSIKVEETFSNTTKNDECYNLWYRRNLIYAENGYCFTSNLGKEVFKNFRCITTLQNLSPKDKSKVDSIKIHEDALGCNINVNLLQQPVPVLVVDLSRLIQDILILAIDNGGVNHESEIQHIISEIISAPKNKNGNKKLARSLNDKGHSFLRNEDIENAIDMFQQAHVADISDVEITNNLGYVNMKAGNLDDAEKYLIDTLVLSPTRATAWGNLGDMYALKGEENKAIGCYANMYRFSKNRINTDKFMRQMNSNEDVESLKVLRGKAIRLANNWFSF